MPAIFPASPFLIPDLERDEAHKGHPNLEAYPDPLSGGAPWTIGYGHTGREVHPGLVWTDEQCVNALMDDAMVVRRGLTTALPWGMHLEPLRADCLINMAFNMGVHGLVGFSTFLGLVRKGLYAAAADDLKTTKWFGQVGDRAERIFNQMRTGVHQP